MEPAARARSNANPRPEARPGRDSRRRMGGLIRWQRKSAMASAPGAPPCDRPKCVPRLPPAALPPGPWNSASPSLQEVGYNCHPNGHAFYLGRAARER